MLAAVPAVAVAGESGPPAGWQEVTGGYKNSAYAVWFPKGGKVKASQDSIVSPSFGQIRIFRSVLERKDGSVFAAGEIILPPKLVKAPPKVRQNFFRDLALDELNGKLVEEKKTTLKFKSGSQDVVMAGKEFLIRTPTGMARYRVYGTGFLVFRVLVVGTRQQLESKDASTFLNSFRRTPQTGASGSKKAS